jgi:chromosome segregation ATPase
MIINELESALVENHQEVDKLIQKTQALFKTKFKRQSVEILKDSSLNNSIDKRINFNTSIAETSRLSASTEKIGKVVILPDFKSLEGEEKPCDLTKIHKVPNTSLNNNLITENSFINNNVDESFKSTYSNGNLQHNPSMNHRLLEKIKSIKKLETDIREKSSIIDKLNIKIEKQSQEIERLHSKIKSDEQSQKLKKENTTLKNVLKEKDKEQDEVKSQFEELIHEYQEKMTRLFELYNISLEKIKEMNSQLYSIKDENQKLKINTENLEIAKENVEIQMKNLKDNFEETLKENRKISENLNHFSTSIKVLIRLIMNSKESLMSFNENSFKIYDKIRDLFTEEETVASNEA